MDSSTELWPSITLRRRGSSRRAGRGRRFADHDAVDGHVVLGAAVTEAARGLRGEGEQGADRGAGAAPGAELEDLAEEDEGGDDGGRLEVERDVRVAAPERLRNGAGEEDGEEAVEVSGAGAGGDQREHVEPSCPDRGPAALEEGKAAPEDDGRGERELYPWQRAGRAAWWTGMPGSMSPMARASRRPRTPRLTDMRARFTVRLLFTGRS